jgi:transcriptional regulator with XRE-family HTH domain
METGATQRYCKRCGARLASDNTNAACRPCQRTDRDAGLAPPEVPPEFWNNDRLRDALVRERHIGHAVRSYRKHPFHGQRPVSQETAARWLSVSQTQLSRIENGRPQYDLDRLIHWAKTLRIPPELLWFALPEEGDDVNRRNFLVAGVTAAAGTGFMPPPAAQNAASARVSADGEACAQWLAWELWNRRATSLNAEEIPQHVLRALNALPPTGTLILRDADDNFSFAHPSLIDFFVAQRIFGDLSRGSSDLLMATQTSHDTDQVIRRFVQHDTSCVPILASWMRDGNTPVLRVNSAGILAKLGQADISDQVISALRQDADTRHLYLTAVASRVLAMPWEEAGKLAGGGAAPYHAMPTGHAAELAVRLSQEIRHSQDGAARWCSVVLLSRFAQPVPGIVTSALRETLRGEQCRETLRAIACTLSNADPLGG